MKKITLTLILIILALALSSCAILDALLSTDSSTDTSTSNNTNTDTSTDTSTDTDTDENSPCSHVPSIVPGTEPSCTQTGLTQGSVCSLCGETLLVQEIIPATDHIDELIPGYAKTCTRDGLSDGVKCSVCNKIILEQEVIKAGHTEVIYKEIPASCTSTGTTEWKSCSVCKVVLVDAQEIPMTEHERVIMPAREPSCEKVGLTQGEKCKNCNLIYVEQEEIEKIPHIEATLKAVPQSCGAYGYTEGKYCKVCSTITVQQIQLPKLEHNLVTVPGTEPTCSQTGLTEGKQCTVCKQFAVPQIVLSTTSHTVVIEKAVEPTCQSVGYTEGRSCSVCKKVILERTELAKTGHTEVVLEAVSANCSNTGLTEGKKCGVCNTIIVAQQTTPITGSHVYGPQFSSVSKTPTTSSSGSATQTCQVCGKSSTVSLNRLSSSKLSKADIYSVTTNEYNPAIDNLWKIFDGNTSSAGFYSPGDDWFGNVGDVLVITLKQETYITSLAFYLTGNHTSSSITLKNAAGETVATANPTVDATNKKVSYSVNKYVYSIEFKITALKWNSAYTHKLSEVEITGAKPDTRLPHSHVYREYVKTTNEATCLATGTAIYSCYCGLEKEQVVPKKEHTYDSLTQITEASCTSNGKAIYACDCGRTTSVTLESTGHIYYKLVNYISKPTSSKAGEAVVKCIGCNQTENQVIAPLPIEEVNYLRVDSMSGGKVVLKLNIYGDRPSYEVRVSTSEITEENYSNATIVNATISGEYEISIEIELDASLDNRYYVAVVPYNGENYGKMQTVRVGGNRLIPIDYHSANVYHGEVLNSFANLFDEQTSVSPSTKLNKIFTDTSDTILYGMNLSPIVDLEYMHYVTQVSLYFDTAGYKIKVRWSSTPVDFMANDSEWDGFYSFESAQGWNDIKVNGLTRYIQVIFVDGQSPCEITCYGYQCGSGDTISNDVHALPTIGDMMGMCGFTAVGGGNTPIDSVICTTVLREYRNFGWGYTTSNYPNKASFFASSWMGNFDKNYKEYTQAGLNVIPCIQWDLVNVSVSHKVDENKLPVKSNGSYVRANFWERFDPHTYFAYADNVFSFAARYGSNASTSLRELAALHCSDTTNSVGLGYLKWIELGNEPEGSWNGVHNYFAAYQLAALTSASYDGHCRTMVSSLTSSGYHLGGKNADAGFKLAMAGVSGISNEYITALCYWMKANREDGKVALDAFNVHHYMSKQITFENGSTSYVGMSPEEANIAGILSQLVGIRNKYYSEKEVWITEFGWDTNQSYATVNSSHAYAGYTGREVQAMWLTRTYLLLSAIGVDKATMYMCEDGGVEEECVGKFGTSGVIGFEYDENGKTYEVKKDSYYYLYTLKSTLGDYTFSERIEAYDENVYIYKYTNAQGKVAFAVWCGTSDGTTHKNYQLGVGSSSATLVEAIYGDIDGIETSLVADELGYVSIDVTENPIYILAN